MKVVEITKRDVLFLLLFIAIAGAWAHDHFSMKKELETTILAFNATDSIQKRYKDELHREHVKGEAREYTIAQLQSSNDASILELKKQVKNIKNLLSSMKVSSVTADTFKAASVDTSWVDTNGVKVEATGFKYADKWLNISALKSKTDSMTTVEYALNNVQRTTWQYERETKWKFWKAKHLVFEIESENPHTTVNKVQTVVVQAERRKFYETQWFAGLVGIGAGLYIRGR